ncbi:hypothetical protein IQ230_08260 [Gloeocapsopsis crepidinum LEGE 06123]|uniref:Uncharacterized protein n=1 Tax=Gloeocapsopsis crepidinum LEGE 06123 TaxID=588587 RepID=A0ABR9UPZ7_9CHRO|nr:hypothetical protein [Gloeocapsopsis crepidinum]MBE9190351.1 hypothetical protein [Gloeocapsopsis crepidinum LEGE 06123]
MRFSYKYLLSSLIILAVPTTAIAQTPPPLEPTSSDTLPQAYYRAFFTNAPDFYRDRTLLRQLSTFFGIGSLTRNSFPENEYARDARLINILYQDTLQQQAGSTTIRTPDLQNPYDSSLFLQPPADVTTQDENNISPDTDDVENLEQNDIDVPSDAEPTEDSPIENDFESETETPEIVPFE